MFTGLVAGRGAVTDIERSDEGLVLTIESSLASSLKAGDSIAVNGVCLTSIDEGEATFRAEVMNETLDRTSLGEIKVGQEVNLELAMRASDRLGGHIVQGHVDGVGRIASVIDDGFARRITIEAPDRLRRYVVTKGSITIDGVSLTVATITPEGFQVSIIPETLKRTTLGRALPGDAVNLEVDVMAKYADKFQQTMASFKTNGQVGEVQPNLRLIHGHAASRTNPESSEKSNRFSTIEEAIEELAQGRMIVVVDDEDRENEGDLVMAAQHVTPEAINFMAMHGRGWICLTLTPDRCDELDLEMMTPTNKTTFSTPFTVTIEARDGVTTGISAADRARTILTAIDPNCGPEHIVKGGHINPLRAKPGGVLERTGHTEASVDLARLAGCVPAGVICEIMNQDGTMARVPDLIGFCEQHQLKLVTIADLVEYRRLHDRVIECEVSISLPTQFGTFVMYGYRDLRDGREHLALVKGDVRNAADVLVRVHSSCMTGDVFHSMRCDCGGQLEAAMARIEQEGRGVLLYLSQEGRGIGLLNKLKAYRLQEQGYDTVDANAQLGFAPDLRDYNIGAQIIEDLGIVSVRILTNNPKKISGLERYGVDVTERIPIVQQPNPHNEGYLRVKAEKLDHMMDGMNSNISQLPMAGNASS